MTASSRATVPPRLCRRWRVPFCTTTSPGLSAMSAPLSSSRPVLTRCSIARMSPGKNVMTSETRREVRSPRSGLNCCTDTGQRTGCDLRNGISCSSLRLPRFASRCAQNVPKHAPDPRRGRYPLRIRNLRAHRWAVALRWPVRGRGRRSEGANSRTAANGRSRRAGNASGWRRGAAPISSASARATPAERAQAMGLRYG
jgi:hypothetical protein